TRSGRLGRVSKWGSERGEAQESVLGGEGPLLERVARAVGREVDHPQVLVLLADRVAVAHEYPGHAGVSVGGDDLARHREDFGRAVAFGLPHLGDRRAADDRLAVRALRVSRV